jgi:hypothetical protein
MRLTNPFSDFAIGRWLDTLLPDFILAFAFFTALTYAILGKRFEHQRSAVAASAALGMALSVGLVWWEQAQQLSIRNLGPIAVGFAILVLGVVMYQAIRQAGGTWAGAGIALGVSLLIAVLLGVRWPVAQQIVQTVSTTALVVGLLAFIANRSFAGPIHAPASGRKAFASPPREAPISRRDTEEMRENTITSDLLGRRMKDVERRVDHLHDHPEEAGDAMLQIRRMLPAEGWLTERMARLREKAYRVRQGHVARIEEIQHVIQKLSPEAKRKASEELIASYKGLHLDVRLDRLDRAAAANERRIREILLQAQAYAAKHEHRQLHEALEAARKLQKHNSKLFKLIDHTEAHLQALAKTIADNHAEVSRE